MSRPDQWVSLSAPYLSAVAGDAWAAEAAEKGRVGTQVVGEVVEIASPAEIAAALGLNPGDPVVLRDRTVFLDERPFELVRSYFPARIARDTRLADPRKIPGGATTLLTQLGYPARQVTEEITVHISTAQERTRLALHDGEPVLVLTRLICTDGGLPVELSIMTMPALRRRLSYQMSIS